jgi:SAM-dependent methyltransferase
MSCTNHGVGAAQLASWCIYRLNSLAAWSKKSRKVFAQNKVVKVNFGSSLVVADGWINVDGSPHILLAGWPKPVLKVMYRHSDARNWCGDEDLYITQLKTHRFLHHNLEYGLPFPDNTVDYLYSSHVLEHFYVDTAEFILRDAYRVMKKGSRLRVCVPDLQYAFTLYAQGNKEQALTYFFEPRRGSFNRHRYMYDFDLLASLLQKVEFSSIERFAYRQGFVPDLDRLDNRPDETLYVEAVK